MMRVRWLLLGLLSAALVGAGACSLNPQPLPPASENGPADGGGSGYDATNGRSDSGTPGDGAIASADSGADVPPAPPGTDATVDGESPDAATDAADAGGTDAAEDAPEAGAD